MQTKSKLLLSTRLLWLSLTAALFHLGYNYVEHRGDTPLVVLSTAFWTAVLLITCFVYFHYREKVRDEDSKIAESSPEYDAFDVPGGTALYHAATRTASFSKTIEEEDDSDETPDEKENIIGSQFDWDDETLMDIAQNLLKMQRLFDQQNSKGNNPEVAEYILVQVKSLSDELNLFHKHLKDELHGPEFDEDYDDDYN